MYLNTRFLTLTHYRPVRPAPSPSPPKMAQQKYLNRIRYKRYALNKMSLKLNFQCRRDETAKKKLVF